MLYAIVAVIALILDQAVKFWTTANIVLNDGMKALIPGFIHLTNIHNTGAAFSILEGARWFFVALCLVFVALIIYVLLTDIINTPGARWMAVLVMAGAVGNCIDRVICGYVVDMFEFEGFLSWFPVFNVADIYITVGGILFCVFTLLEKPKTVEEQRAAAKAEPKAVKSPFAGMKLPKRRKTAIPDFPKREHVTDSGRPDPNDPFAEWERRASAKAQPKAAEQQSDAARMKAEAEAFVRSQTKEAPAAPVQPKAEPKVVVEKPVYQQPVTPAAPKAAGPVDTQLPKEVEDFDFNIDDILAEFKDI